ncbi:MAG: hypothetical protein Q9209_000856 [Squamulea sp. 1 TL-2023]
MLLVVEVVCEELDCSDAAVVGALNEAELVEKVTSSIPVLEPLDEVREDTVKTFDPESDAKLLNETVLELREIPPLIDDNVVPLLLEERFKKIVGVSGLVENRPNCEAVTVKGVLDDSFVGLATRFDVVKFKVLEDNSLDRLGAVLDDIKLEVALEDTLDKLVLEIDDEELEIEMPIDDTADNADNGEDEVDIDARLADRLETKGDDVVALASVDVTLDPVVRLARRLDAEADDELGAALETPTLSALMMSAAF